MPRLPALLAAPAMAERSLWLTNGRLFDGSGAPLRATAAVLVDRGRIARICDSAERTPDDAIKIELGGRTLLPGLIDAHAHVAGSGGRPEPPRGAEPVLSETAAHFVGADLRRALRMGFTTVRDVGSYGDRVLAARQAMRYGAFRGPRLLTCGRIVSATSPGGRFFDGMYREADGPEEMRKAVREQLRRGADFVKLMTTGARSVELEDPEPAQMTRAEVASLVEEAHRMGYRVAAHAEGLAGTEIAIEEGVDTVEHGMYLHRRPDLLERMAACGQVLVPTLSCFYGVAGEGDESDAEPYPWTANSCWSPLLVDLAKRQLEEADRTVAAARSAGVRIASGHDWNPIWNSAIEVVRLAHHGLGSRQALTAATGTAAYAIGLQDSVGTVEAGKLADLIVIDGDPTEDPSLLLDPHRIWLVIQLGAPVTGAALENDTPSNRPNQPLETSPPMPPAAASTVAEPRAASAV